MFKDTPEGQTHSCTHTDNNEMCDVCLGKERTPICTYCGEPMVNDYDEITKDVSKYLWFCPCAPDLIISIG